MKVKEGMSGAIVELEGVSASYDGDHVIEGVNLVVEEGDLLGLVGPNGGGKTTLIKVILGLIRHCCGTVKLFGIVRGKGVPNPPSLGSLMGYVPQNSIRLWSGFPATVEEVVATGLASWGRVLKRLGRGEMARIKEALELVGLWGLKGRRMWELSGGEQQRAFIARALVVKPKLLILDEPTSGIDAPSQAHFYSVLERLNRELGITIILSSHDLGVVSKLANKLACINRRLFYHGEPKPFLSDAHRLSQLYGHSVGLVMHWHEGMEGVGLGQARKEGS